MNCQDREKSQIPKGGAWYPKQAAILDALSMNKGYIEVAWDVAAGEGKKADGLYATAEEFYEYLLQTPPDERFGYELIPENTLCKAYADVDVLFSPPQFWVYAACESAPSSVVCSSISVALGRTRPVGENPGRSCSIGRCSRVL